MLQHASSLLKKVLEAFLVFMIHCTLFHLG